MRHGLVARMLTFLMLLVVIDRAVYSLLAAGFGRIEVGETGGLVNKVRKVRADVVVLGSSRAWRHYDSRVLQEALHAPVYNAGCDGQGLPYVRSLVDLLLADYQPKLFIINVDARSIVRTSDHFDRIAQLAPFMDESSVIREMIYQRGRLEPLKYLSHSFRYNGKPLMILKNLFAKDTSMLGFMPLNRRFDPSMLPASTLSGGQKRHGPELVADPSLLALLGDIVRAAKTGGVQVVLVTSPRWHAQGIIAPNHVPLLKRITALAWREQAPYITINVENEAAFRDPSLYADLSHLNADGARLFSEILGRRLGALGLAVSPGSTD